MAILNTIALKMIWKNILCQCDFTQKNKCAQIEFCEGTVSGKYKKLQVIKSDS